MKQLLTLVNEEMTISHRIVAENTANEEISIRKLIDKYISDFKEFGMVSFEMTKTTNTNLGNGRPSKTYFLNEQQVYLLFTYLRNNEIVRNFKVALIKAFFEMRQELYHIASKSFQGKSVLHTINGLKGGLAVKDRKINQLESRIQFLASENESLKIEKAKAYNEEIEPLESMVYTKEDVIKLLSKGIKYDKLLKDYYSIYDKYDSICMTFRMAYPDFKNMLGLMERMKVHIPK